MENQLLKHLLKLLLLLNAYGLLVDLAVLKAYKGGDAHDHELSCKLGLLVYIDLAYLYGIVLVCKLMDDGYLHTAGSAPLSPEIKEHGFVALKHFCIKIILGDS